LCFCAGCAKVIMKNNLSTFNGFLIMALFLFNLILL